MMWKDFAPFLKQYREKTDQYMDDWWIATNNDEAGWVLHVQAIHDFLNMWEALLFPKSIQMRNHVASDHVARMAGHWGRTSHQPIKGHMHLWVAKNAH
jgi:hypothetical protein